MRVPASPLLVFGIASAASFGWSAPASPAIGGFHQPGMHNSSAIGSDSPAPGQSATFDSPAPPPMNRFDPGLQSFRSSFNEPADSGTNAGQVSSQGPGAESEDWVADYDESHRPLSTDHGTGHVSDKQGKTQRGKTNTQAGPVDLEFDIGDANISGAPFGTGGDNIANAVMNDKAIPGGSSDALTDSMLSKNGGSIRLVNGRAMVSSRKGEIRRSRKRGLGLGLEMEVVEETERLS